MSDSNGVLIVWDQMVASAFHQTTSAKIPTCCHSYRSWQLADLCSGSPRRSSKTCKALSLWGKSSWFSRNVRDILFNYVINLCKVMFPFGSLTLLSRSLRESQGIAKRWRIAVILHVIKYQPSVSSTKVLSLAHKRKAILEPHTNLFWWKR